MRWECEQDEERQPMKVNRMVSPKRRKQKQHKKRKKENVPSRVVEYGEIGLY